MRGGTSLTYGGKEISFARPFARVAYFEAMRSWGGHERAKLLDPAGARGSCGMGLPPSQTHGHALDKIFERVVEPHLVEPTFVYDYPVAISPLAKRKAGDPGHRRPLRTLRREFRTCERLHGTQRSRTINARRFEAQIEERKKGDDEVPPPDWDFVNALEYGMPPTAGIGIGVDRLVMLLTDQQSIREVMLFPLQRPLA